jgi:hypothetical protein
MLPELLKKQFVAVGWNADPTAVGFLYKHSSKPGKTFALTVRHFAD